MKRLFVIAIKANILAGKGTITSITNCPGPMPKTFSLQLFSFQKVVLFIQSIIQGVFIVIALKSGGTNKIASHIPHEILFTKCIYSKWKK